MRPEPAGGPCSEAAWMRQLARLVAQAVEWRTLAEPNRDVFLAENLLWLHREAFPGRRVLALAHTSHTERLPAKAGGLLAQALGPAYRTVSMTADSGSYRAYGEPSELTAGSTMERFEIDPEGLPELAAAVGRLHAGSFLVRLDRGAETAGTLPIGVRRPDVMVFLRDVEPWRQP